MIFEYISLGSTPADEPCEQLTPDNLDYATKARAECIRYRDLLRATYAAKHPKHPALPDGCTLVIKSNYHDFGTYYEVCAKYDPHDDRASRAAYWLESNAPTSWAG